MDGWERIGEGGKVELQSKHLAIKIIGNDLKKNTPELTNNQSKLLWQYHPTKSYKNFPVAPSMQNAFLWGLLYTARRYKY